jgi:Acyclic terpene utilisation family protein AtuA
VGIRIANCSGFFGDRASAAREMVEGGPIDVLTGDYLAELTMGILARHRLGNPAAGYVPTFLHQLEEVLTACVDRGIAVVANAGGLNPAALAVAVEDLAARLGVRVRVATVTGDDLIDVAGDLVHDVTGETMAERGATPLTANAYLGGWGISRALAEGADVVVTGRVADASLVSGPAAWHFGWERHDWDRLAGAVVAGHVIECGAQATGGNFSFFTEVPGLAEVGFPIADVEEDGSAIITKHPGTGGMVTVETITAQLLYEVAGPRYLNPDVVARLDTVELADAGPDRVRISGAVGEPPPATTRVAATAVAGYRNSVTFVIPGLDVEAKAAVALAALWRRVGPPDSFQSVDVRLVRTDQADPPSPDASSATLKVTVTDDDPAMVGRRFSNAAVELALATYPGFLLTEPPGAESPRFLFWPSAADQPVSMVTVAGETVAVPPTGAGIGDGVRTPPEVSTEPTGTTPTGPTVPGPLGELVGTRSGDKGGDANLGVWARHDEAFAWLDSFLTEERVRSLVSVAADLPIERHVFPRLRAINFVLRGYLDEGAASSTRADPQAKALGEFLRARVVDLPAALAGRGDLRSRG